MTLTEIPAAKRTRTTRTDRALEAEWKRIRGALPSEARVIALDRQGHAWSTAQLVHRLERWMHDGRTVALLVGGADGIAPAGLETAEASWSLSALTLPHGLVRVILAEQIYRAWATLQNHPYHRE